jgi:hypothetical protein
MIRHVRVFALVTVATLVSACSDSSAGPEAPTTLPVAPNASAVKFWDANAAANWNEQATSLAARQTVNVNRLHVYLSLAQLRAAEDAERIRPQRRIWSGDRSRFSSDRPGTALLPPALATAPRRMPHDLLSLCVRSD